MIVIGAGSGSARGEATKKPASAPKAKEPVATHVDRMLRTGDGWQIATTYYPSLAGQQSPVVILLHGRQDDRLVWDQGFAEHLQNQGYAVIAVDLRKHGKSQSDDGQGNGKLNKADFAAMITEDLRAVKDFLMAEHQDHKLNIRKTAIIAAEMSVPVALAFTAADWLKPPFDDAAVPEDRTPRGQDIRALVMISPELSIPGLQTARYINEVRSPDWGIASLTIYASGDKLDKGDARKLYNKLTVAKDTRSYIKTYPVSLRGTKLLDADTDMEAEIQAFLKDHLRGIQEDWRDRKSPLQN